MRVPLLAIARMQHTSYDGTSPPLDFCPCPRCRTQATPIDCRRSLLPLAPHQPRPFRHRNQLGWWCWCSPSSHRPSPPSKEVRPTERPPACMRIGTSKLLPRIEHSPAILGLAVPPQRMPLPFVAGLACRSAQAHNVAPALLAPVLVRLVESAGRLHLATKLAPVVSHLATIWTPSRPGHKRLCDGGFGKMMATVQTQSASMPGCT